MASATQLPQWSDLPADVLGHVLARVPLPADRARFRAACRSWRSTPGWRLPWIVHRDGTFVTFPDRGLHRLPLPDNASFLGATTNGWLALERLVQGENEHACSYSLHNPFTGTTLPLPGLDSVIGGKVSEWFQVRKVLMRSRVDDIIVVTTNSCYYPVILCRAGKQGAWIPNPMEMPYARIIDVEFLGDRLYGITSREELVVFDLDDDDDEGMPTVSSVHYVIRHPMSGEEEDMNDDDQLEHGTEGLSADEEEEEDNLFDDDDDDTEYNEVASIDEEDSTAYVDDELEEASTDWFGSDEASSVDEEIDDDDVLVHEENGIIDIGVPDNEVPLNRHLEAKDFILNSWHLLESNGKLLMVRRQKCIPVCYSPYNIKVEVFVADMNIGSWVPAVCKGLEQGQRLFISKRFCKSVPAPTKNLTCYFVDQSDIIVDRISELYDYEYYDTRSTWVFPPEVVL